MSQIYIIAVGIFLGLVLATAIGHATPITTNTINVSGQMSFYLTESQPLSHDVWLLDFPQLDYLNISLTNLTNNAILPVSLERFNDLLFAVASLNFGSTYHINLSAIEPSTIPVTLNNNPLSLSWATNPEPATFYLIGATLLGLLIAKWRSRISGN